jgi:hypothetical protein
MTAPGERSRGDDSDNDTTAAARGGDGPPPTVPIDPEGDDPAHIPDPMPDELRRTAPADRAFDDTDPMEGDAPSG